VGAGSGGGYDGVIGVDRVIGVVGVGVGPGVGVCGPGRIDDIVLLLIFIGVVLVVGVVAGCAVGAGVGGVLG